MEALCWQRRWKQTNYRPQAYIRALFSYRCTNEVQSLGGDIVIGHSYKQAIASLVERKSGYALIRKASNKILDLVSVAIIGALTPIENKAKTIIFDNRKECAEHAKIDEGLSFISYFADTYAS